MTVHQLSSRTIADLDRGRLGVAIDLAIAAVYSDLERRPADDRPRNIVIKLQSKPVANTDGDHVTAEEHVTVGSVKFAIPAHETGVVRGGLRKRGVATFDDLLDAVEDDSLREAREV